MTIAIIDTGCANLASVGFALERLGQPFMVTQYPGEAAGCDRLVLPGVGAAGPAMARLVKSGWSMALKQDRRSLLGICLGMQLLFERSEEGDVSGLGLLPGRVKRLVPGPGEVWPHMGWNTLQRLCPGEPLLDGIEAGSHAFFVHGYYVPDCGLSVASCEYGDGLSALVRSGSITGCQFHPERSGTVGARILQNFCELAP
jgi:glutamine amidotransferase